jgi:hypothetical protein
VALTALLDQHSVARFSTTDPGRHFAMAGNWDISIFARLKSIGLLTQADAIA